MQDMRNQNRQQNELLRDLQDSLRRRDLESQKVEGVLREQVEQLRFQLH
jgi:transcriptional regulator NrdR family protein